MAATVTRKSLGDTARTGEEVIRNEVAMRIRRAVFFMDFEDGSGAEESRNPSSENTD